MAQHLIGNLNHYIGQGTGDTGYVRRRYRGFSTTGSSREELMQAVQGMKEMLDVIIYKIDRADLVANFPLEIPHGDTKRGVGTSLRPFELSSWTNKLPASYTAGAGRALHYLFFTNG